MLTDDLTRAMAEAAGRRQSFPDVTVALDRARRSTRRRRCARGAVVVSVACLSVATAVRLSWGEPHGSAPLAVGSGLHSAGGPIVGQQAFTAPEDRAAERERGAAPCVFNIDLGAGAIPRTIGTSCTGLPTGDRSQNAPMSRQDYVRIHGRMWLITSGTVPEDAVSVTAVDSEGTPLTATLVHLDYVSAAAFVIRSTGHGVKRLQYHLADGRSSQYNDLSTP
jgi:hypothetical protein